MKKEKFKFHMSEEELKKEDISPFEIFEAFFGKSKKDSEKMKKFSYYFLWVILVLSSWFLIALITVLLGESIGIRPGRLILGALGLYSIKWAKETAKKLKGFK